MEGKRLSNKEVIALLKEILAAMEVKNVNPFRVRAYQNAISILDNLTESIYDLWENKRLKEIPGVGPGIESHLNELFTTGVVSEFESIKEDLPEGMFALIGLRGIGAKRAYKLALAFKLGDRET
ncbi:DNA polymerase/3'-5' exonuclease PolX, partial [Patescibacteria group bacterium]|nr:DNA polymerase/3'-5' exonuclease PolX [Patescibacteria group bacterium]